LPRPIKFRIERIKIPGIQVILHDPKGFAKPLEMYDFTFPEELDRISDIGIVNKAEDIVISSPALFDIIDIY
jgi:hypothetical protein